MMNASKVAEALFKSTNAVKTVTVTRPTNVHMVVEGHTVSVFFGPDSYARNADDLIEVAAWKDDDGNWLHTSFHDNDDVTVIKIDDLPAFVAEVLAL